MAKNSKDLVEIKSASADALLEIGGAERALAEYLEVDLEAAVHVQVLRIAHDARVGTETALRRESEVAHG